MRVRAIILLSTLLLQACASEASCSAQTLFDDIGATLDKAEAATKSGRAKEANSLLDQGLKRLGSQYGVADNVVDDTGLALTDANLSAAKGNYILAADSKANTLRSRLKIYASNNVCIAKS